MIFFIQRFNSFLAFFLCATLLTSCYDKISGEPAPSAEDDKVNTLIQKEIDTLMKDRTLMQERIDSVQASMEENALRPKLVEYSRKEYFQYDSMMRQIDQQIDYFKIRKALRTKDIQDRIKMGLSRKDLDAEFTAAEIDSKANIKKYSWRLLPPPPKKEVKGGEKKDEHGADSHGTAAEKQKSSH
jgi:hypothetical protein